MAIDMLWILMMWSPGLSWLGFHYPGKYDWRFFCRLKEQSWVWPVMACVCPCHRNRRRPCDKVKLLALLCAAVSGFTLLELFYSEITPIRKIVTPSELYVSNKQRQRQTLRIQEGITTTPSPKVTPPAPRSTPAEITFTNDNSHGVEGIFVENGYRFPEQKMESVAIGCAITCRKLKDLTTSNIGQKAPVIRTLLSSFCKTASIGFEYHFYRPQT